MKKLLTASIATLMLCALTACGNGTSTGGTSSTGTGTSNGSQSTGGQTSSETITVSYDFSGVETETVQYSSYNVFDGVTILSSTGVSLKTKTTVTSDCGIDGNKLDTSVVRTCTINYTTSWSTQGQTVTGSASRDVVVTEPTIQEGNLVSNSSFEAGTTDWELATHEGGDGTFEVVKVDDVMGESKYAAKVTMAGLNWTNDSSPRLNSATYETNNARGDGADMRFTMTGGQSYKVSFKAKALTTKYVNVSIGQLMAASPWYEGFTSTEQTYVAEITDTWKEFEYTFTATHDTLEGCSILFSMGRVAPTAEVITTLWYTDVYVGVYEGTVTDDKAPTLSGVNDVTVTQSSSAYNVLSGVTATDNVDGNVSESVKAYYNGSEITTLDISTAGTYEVSYEVTDKAGNKAEGSRTITVVAKGTNLLGTYDAARFAEESWCESWISQSFRDETDGSVYVHTVGIGEQSYVNQINMNNLPVVSGNSYTLTFKVKSPNLALTASFIQNQGAYTTYASASIAQSSTFVEVTMEIPAQEFDTVNKVTIELGTLASDVEFWIADVCLVQN